MKRLARLCIALAGSLPVLWATSYDIVISPGSAEITLYRGDSLSVVTDVAGTVYSTIGSGQFVEPVEVLPGDTFMRAFPEPGFYSLNVRDADDGEIGAMAIHVVSVDLSRPVACEIGFTRSLDIPIELHGGQLYFASSDPSLLSVAVNAINDSVVTLSATAHGRGSAAVRAIIAAPNGPVVVGEREVDEFAIRSHLQDGFIFHRHEDGFGHGQFGFTLEPKIDYVYIEVDFFVPTMSVNGQTYFTVPGSQLNDDGSWTAPFVLAPDFDMTCHRLQVFQP